MKKVIVLSSITYALKAQELLKSNGIYANITRSKAVRNIRGCGYGISFDEAVYGIAQSIVTKSGNLNAQAQKRCQRGFRCNEKLR